MYRYVLVKSDNDIEECLLNDLIENVIMSYHLSPKISSII